MSDTAHPETERSSAPTNGSTRGAALRKLSQTTLAFAAGIAMLGVACRDAEGSGRAEPSSAERAKAVQTTGAKPSNAAPAPGADVTPVLVELFTSEGCSSCPPADAELAHLERDQPIAGAWVIPLGHHVDYWNDLGWTDPFSSSLASDRQRDYSNLGQGSYTPQAVIDGTTDAVGSRVGSVEHAISDAARKPHAKVTIKLAPGAQASSRRVTITTGALPAGSSNDAEVVLALTQAAARVAVPRGENAGSTLDHTAIVRTLRIVGRVAQSGGELSTEITAPAGSAPEDLRLTAFVQEHGRRHVLGAAMPVPL